MSDLPQLRVSDADREATVVRLQQAAGEGRLTVEELAERVERADAARTAGELEALTADLPGSRSAAAVGRPAPRDETNWVVAVMSGADRSGRWRPGRQTNAVAFMGGVEIDLRDADLGDGIEITAVAVMGGVDVTVPPGVEVEVTGFSFMGGHGGPRPEPLPPGAPLVRVRCYAFMGGVSVSRRKPRALKR